jgi:hypothetical protein
MIPRFCARSVGRRRALQNYVSAGSAADLGSQVVRTHAKGGTQLLFVQTELAVLKFPLPS